MPFKTRSALLAMVGLVALTLAGCGKSDGAAATASPTGPTANCSYPADGQASKKVDPPAGAEPTTGSATVTLALSAGVVTLTLDRAKTPCTTGSFVHLTQAGYFDTTTCHRLTASETLSVLQCGDPSGTGGGGPGYSFADETSNDMTYPAGTVAMANAGPDTNGSQFFLVYADSQLPPQYTVFGKVTVGLDVLKAIGAKGTTSGGSDGTPVTPVTITTATVS